MRPDLSDHGFQGREVRDIRQQRRLVISTREARLVNAANFRDRQSHH
jgi:hypothetical protein